MEDLIKELNNLRPTREQVKDKPAYYAFGYVDAINAAIELVKNLPIPHVSNRRELLIAFACKLNGVTVEQYGDFYGRKVDKFLKSN